MIEKKVSELEKLNQLSEELITLYTSLVEYYSVRDKLKYDEYMEKMKNGIK